MVRGSKTKNIEKKLEFQQLDTIRGRFKIIDPDIIRSSVNLEVDSSVFPEDFHDDSVAYEVTGKIKIQLLFNKK